MKRRLATILCASFAACCVACGAVALALHTPTAETAVQTADSAAPSTDVLRVVAKELTAECGSVSVLTLSQGDESKLLCWESDRPGVVAVDDGGRIDAVTKGVAHVTAHFSDNRDCVYTVTVNAAKAEKIDTHTTAVTANADIVAKNKKAKKKELPLYELNVNRKQNCVTVYTYDDSGEYTVPVRAMLCSCGKKKHDTPTGEFTTYFKVEWHPLEDEVCGRYVTAFSGDFLFHSVPYTDFGLDYLETAEFNKLGSRASLGCVRLAVADAKWIYDNCALGTAVKIYDSDEAEPLGKPEGIRLTDKANGWDPTDPDKKNPYNACKPRIEGAVNRTVSRGAVFDPLKGVKAYDTCGSEITGRLEAVGNIVTTRPGGYRLTLRVTDALGRTAEETVTVTVK